MNIKEVTIFFQDDKIFLGGRALNILETLKSMADLLALQFGKYCEVVIHEVNPQSLDSSLIYIKNAHVSDRKVGDGPSHAVMDALSCDHALLKDKHSYFMQTKNGTTLKSSTLYIKDDNNLVKYVFCINFNINSLMVANDMIQDFIKPDLSVDNSNPERITQSVNEVLDDLIEQSVQLIGKPAPLMNKQEKIKAINFLNNAGAFLITKSGDKISDYFGISKYTLYNYIDVNK